MPSILSICIRAPILGLWGMAMASVAHADSSSALTHAVARAPALQAAWLRVDAARAAAVGAGLMPDPRVEGMAERANSGSGESWPKYQARVEQPLPKRGERAAAREQAQAAIAMAEAEAAMMAGKMAAELAAMLAEAEAADAQAGLINAQRARVETVMTMVGSRIASGQGRLVDRLALQARTAEMEIMAAEEAQMAEDVRLQAGGMLGMRGDARLPRFAAPDPDSLDFDRSPVRRIAAAKEQEAVAMAAMARASGQPMAAIALQASRESMPMENEDMVGIGFMIEIPWNARRAARAGEIAAAANQTAARTDAESARRVFHAAVHRAKRAADLAATVRKISTATLARLDAEYDTLTSSAATGTAMDGTTSILMVLDILEKRVDVEQRMIQAEARAAKARAALWEYSAIPPAAAKPGQPNSPHPSQP